MIITVIKFISIFCIIVGSFSLSGCDGGSRKEELKLYIDQLKINAAQTKNKTNATVWQLPKAVKYPPGENSGLARDTHAVTNPLQAYSIRQLQFVGTLTQDNHMAAYIMTPDSTIYLVKEGDVIGDNYGKIVKIDDAHIEISEKYITAGDQSAERIVKMELKD